MDATEGPSRPEPGPDGRETDGDGLDAVFAALEGELDAQLRQEETLAADAAIRDEIGHVPLWEHLTRRVGTRVGVLLGGIRAEGGLMAAYPDHVVLLGDDGRHHLLQLGEDLVLVLPGRPPPLLPVQAGALARRHTLALALRGLTRQREPVRLVHRHGDCRGTLDVVGEDYLELAEHPSDEAPRRRSVTARLLVPLSAVLMVSPLAPPQR